jgi:glycosyltransferase involved in cell wall biosynthesis
MKICTISFKECWRNADGRWCSDGGFPLQVATIGDFFDHSTLAIVEGEPHPGGIPLPQNASIVPLRSPYGKDFRRKLSVIVHLPYYLGTIVRHARAADVVHAPIPGDLAFLGLIVGLALGKRVIARYESSWTVNSRTTVMNRVTRTLVRWCAGGRNVVLVAGQGESAPAPRIHWHAPTALTKPELDRIEPVLDRGLRDPPHLVYIGRLSPEKNVPRLIRAFALLKREGFRPLPKLTLIGDGPERSRLEALVREEGCSEFVHFTYQLDRAELSRYLGQADICVHPSLTEAAAGAKAWLDAMAHGLPVLACEINNARWTIGADGERGWLAPQGDVETLAAALRRVLTEPCDWPALRRRARAYAETRTLEAWRQELGEICASQWGMSLVDGKLKAKLPNSSQKSEPLVSRLAPRTNPLSSTQQAKAE